MLHRDVRRIDLVKDVNILSRILCLYHSHRSREEALLATRQQVCVLDAPSGSWFKDHALEPHGFRREILDVDLEEDLRAFLGR